MKKKYLSLNHNAKEAEEFVLKAEKNGFSVVKSDLLSESVKIPYSVFKYPEFQDLENFDKEIAKQICQNFGLDDKKLILLSFGEQEEKKIKRMQLANIVEFAF